MANDVFPVKFKRIKTFDIVVPADYDHSTQLVAFAVASSAAGQPDCLERAINDQAFPRTSDKLLPGRTYEARMYAIICDTGVSWDECIGCMNAVHALKTGVQGLSLVIQQKHKELPDNLFIVSPDWPENLGRDEHGHPMVPVGRGRIEGERGFGFIGYTFHDPEGKVGTSGCLLCICEKRA